MKTALALASLALFSGPALAQYGGGAHNSGGPLGSYARSTGADIGYGYSPYYGGHGYYVAAPEYSWGGPTYYGYGSYYPEGAIAAGVVGGLALGALAGRSYYHPRRIYRPHALAYRPHARGYRRW